MLRCFYGGDHEQGVTHMQFPNDANGDVLRRMQSHGFDFSKEHPIEFFAVYASEEEADKVAKMYVADLKSGERLVNIETRPYPEGGMELVLVKKMRASYENITGFEKRLQDRTNTVDGYLDGWGVLQE